MRGIRLLKITDSNLFYGGAHKGTFTVDIEDARSLLNMLTDIYENLSKSNNDSSHVIDENCLENLETIIGHIGEYVEK